MAASRFLNVAGGVFAPEATQRWMAAKLCKGAALDFANGPDGNSQDRRGLGLSEQTGAGFTRILGFLGRLR